MKILQVKVLFLFLLVTIMHTNGFAQSYDTLFQAGYEAQQKGRYKEALPIFQEALEKAGDSLSIAKTHYYLAKCYSSLSNHNVAFPHYRSALKGAQAVRDTVLLMNVLLKYGESKYRVSDFAESSQLLRNLLRVVNSHSVIDENYWMKKTLAHSFLARDYMYSGKLDSANIHAEQAIIVGDNVDHLQTKGETYNLNAEYLWILGYYAQARKFVQVQYDLYEKKHGENHPIMARPIQNLGILSYEIGDYSSALNYLNKSFWLMKEGGDSTSLRFAGLCGVISAVYTLQEQPEDALRFLSTTIDIFSKYDAYEKDLLQYYAHQAALLTKVDEFEAAKRSIALATEINEKYAKSNYHRFTINSRIASAWDDMGETEKCFEYANLALKLSKGLYGENSADVANEYLYASQRTFRLGRYQDSKRYLDSAFAANGDKDGKFLANSTQVNIYGMQAKLARKYRDDRSDDELLSMLLKADSAIISLSSDIATESGKVHLTDYFYDQAFELCLDIADSNKSTQALELAFQFAERNKSRQLRENLLHADIFGEVLREGLRKKKDSLVKLNAILEKNISALIAQSDVDPTEVGKLQNQLLQVNRDYAELKDEIRRLVPKYFDLKYPGAKINVEAIKKYLKQENTNLLTYHLGNENVSVLLLTEEGLYFSRAPWNEKLEDHVKYMRIHSTEIELNSIKEAGKELFAKLIQPLKHQISSENLVIIPEKVLGYLPFELLYDEHGGGNFLVQEYAISYAFSITNMRWNMEKKDFQRKGRLLAFAPDFSKESMAGLTERATLVSLPGAKNEVTRVTDIFSGKAITGSMATETSFKADASNFGLLHLATHAVLDDVYPTHSRLVFDISSDSLNDGYLHAYELYGMNLSTSLVTLSACNTGYGKIQQGEGVMSLGRAFAYAGSPNVLMSLWPANDESTAEIMGYFYGNLKDGMKKDNALRQAKLTYLENADPVKSHPYYWAGFVFTGDSRPLAITGFSSSKWLWLIGLLVIITIVFGARSYRRSRS